MRWVAQREGLPDPFAELDAPARPREEADWLTQQEFARLLAAVDWGDLDLQGPFPSVLVRRGKGGKPRRQPLARELAAADSVRIAVRDRSGEPPGSPAPSDSIEMAAGLRGQSGRLSCEPANRKAPPERGLPVARR